LRELKESGTVIMRWCAGDDNQWFDHKESVVQGIW